MAGGSTSWRAPPKGDIMCGDERLYFLEYVEKASKRFDIPYEALSNALDNIYRRVGDKLLNLLDKISGVLSSYLEEI